MSLKSYCYRTNSKDEFTGNGLRPRCGETLEYGCECAVHEVGDLLLRLNAEIGLTVLIVEQKLPFTRRVASDFRIPDKGCYVAGGAISELTDKMVKHHLTV